MEVRSTDIVAKPPLRLEFGKRRVLERADLSRWTLCLVHLMGGAGDPAKGAISARYLDGLAMIAKSDVHMAFEIQAVAAFYLALHAAMKAYEGIEDEPFPVALRRFASGKFEQMDDGHLDRLIAVGESVNSGRPVPHAMDMNDVPVMKTICDVYLIRAFQKAGLPKRRDRKPSEGNT